MKGFKAIYLRILKWARNESLAHSAPLVPNLQHYHWYAATHSTSLEDSWQSWQQQVNKGVNSHLRRQWTLRSLEAGVIILLHLWSWWCADFAIQCAHHKTPTHTHTHAVPPIHTYFQTHGVQLSTLASYYTIAKHINYVTLRWIHSYEERVYGRNAVAVIVSYGCP